VQLLERVKHLFDVEGIVFVLGIDRTQLCHSIKALYGSEFDATGYLKRFIDLDYRLPEPEIGCYCSYLFASFEIDKLMSTRRQQQETQHDLEDLKYYLGYLISSARMSLRDQEQIVSRLRVILQTVPLNNYLYPVTLSILLFLREWDRNTYMSIVSGGMTYEEFISFIENLPNEAQAYQDFLKMTSYENYYYDGFFKERIEGVFLKGLQEISKASNPKLQEYAKDFNDNNSEKARLILIAAKRDVGFKTTEDRLNFASNFVQN
jgi:hypothetical protein